MIPHVIEVVSFGYRYGSPDSLALCYDLRSLVNPAGRKHAHQFPQLNGTHSAVASFVLSDPRAHAILDSALHDACLLLGRKSGRVPIRIGFGCFAGRHRSVVLANEFSRRLRRKGIPARVIHLSMKTKG